MVYFYSEGPQLSETKDRRYPKYITLYMAYFYSDSLRLTWNEPDIISMIPAQV